jgi:hypothetical protein
VKAKTAVILMSVVGLAAFLLLLREKSEFTTKDGTTGVIISQQPGRVLTLANERERGQTLTAQGDASRRADLFERLGLFDSAQYKHNLYYRAHVNQQLRELNFLRDPILNSAAGRRVLQMLRDEGIPEAFCLHFLRIAVEDALTVAGLREIADLNFADVETRRSERETQRALLPSDQQEELRTRDAISAALMSQGWEDDAQLFQQAAIASFKAGSGIENDAFYDELYSMRFDHGGLSVFPILTNGIPLELQQQAPPGTALNQ